MINPDAMADEPLKIRAGQFRDCEPKRTTSGSLQQDVAFPPAEQHQYESLQRYKVFVEGFWNDGVVGHN